MLYSVIVFLSCQRFTLFPKADIYQAAMRLIDQYGDGAEIATILRGDPFIQSNDRLREFVLDAIVELRTDKDRSRAH